MLHLKLYYLCRLRRLCQHTSQTNQLRVEGLGVVDSLEEIDAYMAEAKREYNSPEAVAKCQAEYEELCRIGELRRQDFYSGRDMDKCHPLPWQRKEITE